MVLWARNRAIITCRRFSPCFARVVACRTKAFHLRRRCMVRSAHVHLSYTTQAGKLGFSTSFPILCSHLFLLRPPSLPRWKSNPRPAAAARCRRRPRERGETFTYRRVGFICLTCLDSRSTCRTARRSMALLLFPAAAAAAAAAAVAGGGDSRPGELLRCCEVRFPRVAGLFEGSLRESWRFCLVYVFVVQSSRIFIAATVHSRNIVWSSGDRGGCDSDVVYGRTSAFVALTHTRWCTVYQVDVVCVRCWAFEKFACFRPGGGFCGKRHWRGFPARGPMLEKTLHTIRVLTSVVVAATTLVRRIAGRVFPSVVKSVVTRFKGRQGSPCEPDHTNAWKAEELAAEH